MKISVNSKEEIKDLNTMALHYNATKCMRQYHEVEMAYKKYLMTFETMHHYHDKIIKESPYEDVYDFLYDYGRYKVGLPIYIEIIVKGEKR